jgi:hypothetical protein
MRVSRETDRLPRPSEPYTPTPDGFESRLRAWVGLPADGVTTSDAEGAKTPPQAHGARDHA